MRLGNLSTGEVGEMATMRKRSLGIDLIRAVSVMYIVGYWHLLGYTNHFVPSGDALTNRVTLIILGLFVFVSGYLMGKKEIPLDKNNLFSFWRKRILRIYPLYLIAILLFWLLHISDGITLAKAAVLSSVFVGPAPSTLWFITMIMLYYFSVPFIIHMSHDYRRLFVYCLAVMIASLVYLKFTKMFDIRAVLFFPAFVVGIYMARTGLRPFAAKMLQIGAISLISCLLSFLPVGSWMLSQILFIPMITFCALVVFLVVQSKESSINDAVILQFLGYSSSCMYLFHRPLYEIMKRAYFPQGPLNQLLYLTLICVPLLIGISFFIQSGYDRLLAVREGPGARAGVSLS